MLLVLTRVLGWFPAHFTLLFSSLDHKALFLHQTGCPWDLRAEHGGSHPSWPPHFLCTPRVPKSSPGRGGHLCHKSRVFFLSCSLHGAKSQKCMVLLRAPLLCTKQKMQKLKTGGLKTEEQAHPAWDKTWYQAELLSMGTLSDAAHPRNNQSSRGTCSDSPNSPMSSCGTRRAEYFLLAHQKPHPRPNKTPQTRLRVSCFPPLPQTRC